jgi:hypothetical protein
MMRSGVAAISAPPIVAAAMAAILRVHICMILIRMKNLLYFALA